ncbi:MAG: hemagglutinin, partial [Asticcacaulis sp.]|nr:hemagglutinin [Asticcacaulis sp.]
MIIISAVSVLAIAAAAPALAMNGPEVKLKDVAAHVVVIPENRSDIDLRVVYPADNKFPTVMVHMEGRKLIADGKIDTRHLDC